MGNMKQLDIEIQERIMELDLPQYVTGLKVVSFDTLTLCRELVDNGYEPSDIDQELLTQFALSLTAELMSLTKPFVYDVSPKTLFNGIKDEDYYTYQGDENL